MAATQKAPSSPQIDSRTEIGNFGLMDEGLQLMTDCNVTTSSAALVMCQFYCAFCSWWRTKGVADRTDANAN
jgi:hypothetical protein